MKEGQPKTKQRSDYRNPGFLIESTKLTVELGEGSTTVRSVLQIRRDPEAGEPAAVLELDGDELTLEAVSIDGRELMSNEYQVHDDGLTVLEAPESFELETRVVIHPEENTALEGLYKSKGMYCTQCEAEGFRRITYYLDRPDVLSRFQTTIVADKRQYPVLLSNGNDVERGEHADGRHFVTWEDPFPKPAYLFALVAGDLRSLEDTFTTRSGREICLRLYTEGRNLDKLDYALDSLKRAMAWDEKVYGREYDLDIFMIVAVEHFNMGAMENKGLNIFNTSCVLARSDTTSDEGYRRVEGVIAHEYFHNWSGNRVTCRDWFQLSLKEGFTVFRDQQFSADMGSSTVCRVGDVVGLRNAQFPEDAGPMAHPVRPDSYIEINNFYTATVYEKGAEVVRMIHTLLGEEVFRAGCDLYFERHDGQAVTTDDFVQAMEDSSGVDLQQFRRWYRQAGTPTLAIQGEYDAQAGVYRLTVEQSCPATPGQDTKEPFHLPLAVGLLDSAGRDMAPRVAEAKVAARSNAGGGNTMVLHVREPTETFVFEGVHEVPTPSLLRGFSAPVKLSYPYDRDQLAFLMRHDSDGFNRWEASQRLGVDVCQEVLAGIRAGSPAVPDRRIVEAFEALLQAALEGTDGIDLFMVAQMLGLPSEVYLGELEDVVDVEGIHRAREAVRLEIAEKLKGLLLATYRMNQSPDAYRPDASSMARRALKNVCLAYLLLPDDDMVSLCERQFATSDNMTDEGAALRALVNSPSPRAREASARALTAFYEKWADEALVIDQWFTIQATCAHDDTLDNVRRLLEHEAFDMKTPNRFRALVGAFATNTVNFHQRSGEGYGFLADQVLALDPINPQVAARVLQPLTRWQKFDEARQGQMVAQLDRILDQEGLSRDVYEIAAKSTRR